MSDKERLQLEQECLLKYSKAQMIEKYIDEFEENIQLSELWCKSQQENKQLKEDKKKAIEYITSYESADTLMSYENKEKNKDLDEKTMIEINRRYLIIQGKLLKILGDKENE